MRSWTQAAHRDPPYARWTVFLGRETVAYSRGRRAGIPGSLTPQSWEPSIYTSIAPSACQTYTALGSGAPLLDVQVSELATGRLIQRLAFFFHLRNREPDLDLWQLSVCKNFNHSPLAQELLTTRTFWLAVLYGARRRYPMSVLPTPFDFVRCSTFQARFRGGTYVGESGGCHFDGVPGRSDEDNFCVG